MENDIYEEWLNEVTHGLPWHSAQRLLESIEQDRKDKAAAVAKRLLGTMKPKTVEEINREWWRNHGL